MDNNISSYLGSINAVRMAEGNLLPEEKFALARYLVTNKIEIKGLNVADLINPDVRALEALADKFITSVQEKNSKETKLFKSNLENPNNVAPQPVASTADLSTLPMDIIRYMFKEACVEELLPLLFVSRSVRGIAKNLFAEKLLQSHYKDSSLKEEFKKILFDPTFQSANEDLNNIGKFYKKTIVNKAMGLAVTKNSSEMAEWISKTFELEFIMSELCFKAANLGHIKMLEWLLSKGCKWEPLIALYPVHNGDLATLQWLHSNGCPWDHQDTCINASQRGDLAMLQWAIANGAYMIEKITFNAAVHGHFEVLKWAVENGCPWKKSLCKILTSSKPEIQQWIDVQK